MDVFDYIINGSLVVCAIVSVLAYFSEVVVL